MDKKLDIKITKRQQLFILATAGEVLYGGAAGGGKSYGQLIDALIFALKYPGSKQLVLRRTYPELEKSLIRVSLSIFPREIYSYNKSAHVGRFINGSIIDFGYCDSENDVFKYQSAEYDIIRFDELTHLTEQMYLYLISRCRGANRFPKQIKSTTNPGGVGHSWVKARFIDIGPPDKEHFDENMSLSRIFIPARVQDNIFLMHNDAGYIERLKALSEKDKKALLYGDWDIFDGQFFSEWDRNVHVIEPFVIPKDWYRYVAIDYGLDMLAAFLIALDNNGRAYVYRETYESGLIVSYAAERILQMVANDSVRAFLAPPDLWLRQKDTGKSIAQIFGEHGIRLRQTSSERVQGWANLHEWLRVYKDEKGEPVADLRVFDCCHNLIRTLPAVQVDSKNPNDVAKEPHEFTHAPDAIRYFVQGQPAKPREKEARPKYSFNFEKPKNAGIGYGDKIRPI